MESSSNFLANRQLVVVKSNLITVFRYAVKALIDKACFCSIDDGCEEFINFSAAMEQVLQHRLRPSKAWYSIEDRSSFWFYIKAACQGRDMLSCINNIDNIENIKSPLAKGHAFLRCALMEKRLADYLTQALKQTTITRRFYQEGAVMLGDEGLELCGVLLGLNAIDFGFCLKGENFGLMPYPLAINYVPFMKFKQSAESLCSDAEEMRELSSCASSIISEDAHDGTPETGQDRYQLLLKRYLCVLEQKSFLEEVAASQEKVLETASIAQQQHLQQQHEMQMQQQQYEAVILELQAQVARMKKVNESLQQQLVLTRQTRLPLTELGTTSRSAASSFVAAMEHQQKLNQQSVNSSNSHPRVAQSVDARSMVSAISDLSEMGCLVGEAHQEMGERQVDDTQSMVPLAGSLMDLSEPKGDSSSMTLCAKSDAEISAVVLHSKTGAVGNGAFVGVFDELNGNSINVEGREISFPGQGGKEPGSKEEEKESSVMGDDLQGSIIVLKELEGQAMETKALLDQSDAETESEGIEALSEEDPASLEHGQSLTPLEPQVGIPTSSTTEDFPLHCRTESLPEAEETSAHRELAGESSMGKDALDQELLSPEEKNDDKKSAASSSDKEEMSEPEVLVREANEHEGANSDSSGSDIAKDAWDMMSDASSQ